MSPQLLTSESRLLGASGICFTALRLELLALHRCLCAQFSLTGTSLLLQLLTLKARLQRELLGSLSGLLLPCGIRLVTLRLECLTSQTRLYAKLGLTHSRRLS